MKYYLIRDKIALGEVNFEKIHADKNPFDMGTKMVSITKFKTCLSILNIDNGFQLVERQLAAANCSLK